MKLSAVDDEPGSDYINANYIPVTLTPGLGFGALTRPLSPLLSLVNRCPLENPLLKVEQSVDKGYAPVKRCGTGKGTTGDKEVTYLFLIVMAVRQFVSNNARK